MQLRDRIAIVTGGGSGIGRAIAQRFADAGASIVIAEIDLDNAIAVQDELRDQGRRALAVHTDVTNETSVTAMIDATEAAFGPADILINNAVRRPGDELHTLDTARWDADVAISLRSVFLCMKAVLPSMTHHRHGVIVNIASVNAFGFYGNEAYSAAKAGVVNLTMSAASRYGAFGVRVNAVAPGTIRTGAWARRLAKDSAVLDKLTKWYPLGRIGEPEDVANAALFLASDEAGWITGAVLRVDGGLLAGNRLMAQELAVETYAIPTRTHESR